MDSGDEFDITREALKEMLAIPVDDAEPLQSKIYFSNARVGEGENFPLYYYTDIS